MHDDDFKPKEQLWDLIKDIKFGMFTTRHGNGHLHARPMTTQNSRLDDDAALWFFLSRQGTAPADLLADSNVCMVYADTHADSYVSVSGTATLSDDRAKKEELWSPFAQAWFPDGIDDTDLALVRLAITHADYSRSSRWIGSSRTRRPVAWNTALDSAAAVPTLASSPRPLTPAGLTKSSTSGTRITCTSATSAFTGTRYSAMSVFT